MLFLVFYNCPPNSKVDDGGGLFFEDFTRHLHQP